MTKIEWTDESWNLWHGCTKVSPGCKNCYAERFAKRLGTVKKYDGRISYFPHRIEDPLHWKKPRMVFVQSMGDLFHEAISSETIAKIWDVMFDCPQHIFQVLTKRPLQVLSFEAYMRSTHRRMDYDNLFFGVSVESPEYLHRIETLLQIPAAVRFVSFEPLLKPFTSRQLHLALKDNISWVIIGCESGPKRRECEYGLRGFEIIVNVCKQLNIPVFVKQVSINGKVVHDIGKFPESVRFREFPKLVT